MSRTAAFLLSAGLISSLAIPAFPETLVNSFQEAAARGDAQERAAATKDYFTKTMMPYFGQKYAPVLQSCFSSVSKPDNSRFSFVAALGTEGRVMRLYRDRETNIFQCMRDTLEKDSFPAPPVTPYYLHIEMNFTGEDAPQTGSQKDAPPLVVKPTNTRTRLRFRKAGSTALTRGRNLACLWCFSQRVEASEIPRASFM